MKTNTISRKTAKKPTRRTVKPFARAFSIYKKKVRRQLKLAFVPHKTNQYQPHLIRRYGIVVILVLVIGIQIGYNYATTGRVLGQKEQVATVDLLRDTNEQRATHHLPALQLDEKLSDAAFMKGQDMFAKQYWAHQAPDGTSPWHWFSQAGYNYAYAGENLAKNFATADAATVAWMASPEHRANILDGHYTQVGFAVVDGVLQGKPTSIIVALYGEPAAAAASVAGVQTAATSVEAPAPHALDVLARLGVAVQSITPAALGAIVLAMVAAGVALLAHTYRRQLPKARRKQWAHHHHGLIKAGGMMSLTLVVLLLYSGGQI